MGYPDNTTIWVSKKTRNRYDAYGVRNETFNDVLTRVADERDLALRELIRLRSQLKRLQAQLKRIKKEK